MINKIISAISETLNLEFGDDYDIYTESIKQGLTEPCFFIQSINPTNTQQIINRRKRSFLFVIQYFPKSTDSAYSEINSVIERLTDCLELIPVEDGYIRGSDVSDITSDKVLNHQITYTFFTINDAASEEMETLTQISKTK